ncbi:MAG: hypothetical protein QM564_01945, partial [Bergeyella sp.]
EKDDGNPKTKSFELFFIHHIPTKFAPEFCFRKLKWGIIRSDYLFLHHFLKYFLLGLKLIAYFYPPDWDSFA